MPIERYDYYGKPRLIVTDTGAYLIRDVFGEDDSFSGVCEYCIYSEDDGEIKWKICREGVEFSEISPFLPAQSCKVTSVACKQLEKENKDG